MLQSDQITEKSENFVFHLTFHTKNGGNSKIVRWAFYKPPSDMIAKYNIIRAENAKIMMEQQQIENKTIDSKVAQKWDNINKCIIWNSFDQELKYANYYPKYYYNFYCYNCNKNNSKIIFGIPIWNYNINKLEWNYIYKK